MSIWQDVLLLLAKQEKEGINEICIEGFVEKLTFYTVRQIRTNIAIMRKRGHIELRRKNAGVAFYSITDNGRASLRADDFSADGAVQNHKQSFERYAAHPLEAAWPMRLQA